MSTRRRWWVTRFAQTRLRWIAAACIAVWSGGCRTLVKIVVEAVTGEDVTLLDEGTSSVPRSVYLRGPTAGWEYWALGLEPPRFPRNLFQVDLFAGACPGLRLTGGESDGPFGAQQVRAELQLFEPTPSHAADPHYYHFGQVTLAGPPDPVPPGASSRMLARWGGACTSVGIPLLSLGRPARHTLHR